MNLDTSEYNLTVSLEELSGIDPKYSMQNAICWVIDIELNFNVIQFLYLWTQRMEDEFYFCHHFMTYNLDCSNLKVLENSYHPMSKVSKNSDDLKMDIFEYEKSDFQKFIHFGKKIKN